MIEKIKEEIQRQLQESEERLNHIKARGWVAPNEEQLIVHLKGLLSFINTLEVKEVDLEKELVDYHNENFSPCNDGTLLSCETGAKLTWNDYKSIAKHFFELGLRLQTETNITFKYNIGESVREYKAQKGEEV